MDSDLQTSQERITKPSSSALNHANTALLLEALSTQPAPAATEEWHTFVEVIDKGTGEVSSIKVLY